MEKHERVSPKVILYIMICWTCSFAMAGAAFLDMEKGHSIYIFDVCAKVFIMVGIFAYASICKVPMNAPGSRFFTPWLLVAMIPFAINLVDCFRIPNRVPGVAEFINMLMVVFSTAAWEELLFRYVGQTVFERNGKYSVGAVVLLSLTFGCSHLINIFVYDPISVLLQMLNACSFGILLLGLYQHTGNLWIVIAAHSMNNLAPSFFELFPGAEFIVQTWIFFVLQVLMGLMVGSYILVKYGYIERKCQSPDGIKDEAL